MRRSAFVISLDFELHWGVRDHTPLSRCRENLLGARAAIPKLLDLFRQRDISATWATVGMLMAATREELLAFAPRRRPRYEDSRLSPYSEAALRELGEGEGDDPFHYAPSLVRQILDTPRQELATHTYSHYYTLERGQTVEDFDADLEAAGRIARDRFGAALKSIVFPRNQLRAEYLDVVARRGIVAYRSSGGHWAYTAKDRETRSRRLFRLADAYAPLSGARTAAWPASSPRPVDVQASAFLRPFDPRLGRLERGRLFRLVGQMRRAARTGGIFHLWWHPHNFGRHTQANLDFLAELLDAFAVLRSREGMQSLSMLDVASAAGGPVALAS